MPLLLPLNAIIVHGLRCVDIHGWRARLRVLIHVVRLLILLLLRLLILLILLVLALRLWMRLLLLLLLFMRRLFRELIGAIDVRLIKGICVRRKPIIGLPRCGRR